MPRITAFEGQRHENTVTNDALGAAKPWRAHHLESLPTPGSRTTKRPFMVYSAACRESASSEGASIPFIRAIWASPGGPWRSCPLTGCCSCPRRSIRSRWRTAPSRACRRGTVSRSGVLLHHRRRQRGGSSEMEGRGVAASEMHVRAVSAHARVLHRDPPPPARGRARRRPRAALRGRRPWRCVIHDLQMKWKGSN